MAQTSVCVAFATSKIEFFSSLLEGSPRLGGNAKAALNDSAAELVVPSIVLVELEFLYAKKRATVSVKAVQRELITAKNCLVYPLDEQVVLLIPTSLNIHDAIIVATGLVYQDLLDQPVKVVSKDAKMQRCRNGEVGPHSNNLVAPRLVV